MEFHGRFAPKSFRHYRLEAPLLFFFHLAYRNIKIINRNNSGTIINTSEMRPWV
jgi:hypothetical protein